MKLLREWKFGPIYTRVSITYPSKVKPFAESEIREKKLITAFCLGRLYFHVLAIDTGTQPKDEYDGFDL